MKKNLLILLIFITTITCYAQAPAIVLNQCGFYPAGPKIAVVTQSPSSESFYILTADKKDTVYRGKLQPPVQSLYSSTTTRIADFSNFKQAGVYVVYVKNIPYSPTFSIQKNVLHNVGTASLKAFYYQRSNIALDEKYAGIWKRVTGHPDTNVLIHPSAATHKKPAGYSISSAGGWYDAGDYNKYIVNSGITMGTLLSAYEDFSFYFDSLKTNIPESNNQIPDILDEVLYNLRWMLTMQDKEDGGVYHKCTNASFDGIVMPGVTKAPRYAVQKGTAATLDFAAVMAQASRIFKNFNKQLPGLADSCLQSAEQAWQWAEKNPKVVYDQQTINAVFTPPISTGAYGDRNFDDEKFWAAAELFVTTKNKIYVEIIDTYSSEQIQLPSWSNTGMLGCYTLMRHYRNAGSKVEAVNYESIKKQIINFSEDLIVNGGNQAFKTIMGQNKKDFIWGSNAVALNQSIALINAYLINNSPAYINAAISNIDYVLGRNATQYCFVTGIGSLSPKHIHHRPSQADGIDDPIPGLLAGGPNPGMQDKCAYIYTETETAYIDHYCSYASNEIAINWNAPLVYVSTAIEALQIKAGLSL